MKNSFIAASKSSKSFSFTKEKKFPIIKKRFNVNYNAKNEKNEGNEKRFNVNYNAKKSRLFDDHTISIYATNISKTNPDEALQFLHNRITKYDRHKSSISVFNTMLDICGHSGKWNKAWKIFNDIKKRSLAPNDMTVSSLFNSLANSNVPATDDQLEKLLEIYLKYAKGNVYAFNSLLKAIGRKGNENMLLKVFPIDNKNQAHDWIPSKLDQITYTTMINSLTRHSSKKEIIQSYVNASLSSESVNMDTNLMLAILDWKRKLLQKIPFGTKDYQIEKGNSIPLIKDFLARIDLTREKDNFKLHSMILEVLGLIRDQKTGMDYLEGIKVVLPRKIQKKSQSPPPLRARLDSQFESSLLSFYYNSEMYEKCLEMTDKITNPTLRTIIILMKSTMEMTKRTNIIKNEEREMKQINKMGNNENQGFTRALNIFKKYFVNNTGKNIFSSNDIIPMEPIYILLTMIWNGPIKTQESMIREHLIPILKKYPKEELKLFLDYKAVSKKCGRIFQSLF